MHKECVVQTMASLSNRKTHRGHHTISASRFRKSVCFEVSLRNLESVMAFLPPETPPFEIRKVNASNVKRGILALNAHLGDAPAKKLGGNPVILMRGHGRTKTREKLALTRQARIGSKSDFNLACKLVFA
jgi:hypothetical protein